MKQIYRGGVLAVLTMGMVNNGLESILANVLIYAIAMKSFNVMSRQLDA